MTAAVVQKKSMAQPPAPALQPDAPKRRGRPAGSETIPHQVYLSPDAKHQLDRLSVDLSRDYGRKVMSQDLLRLAVDLMFERFGKPPIAGTPEFLSIPPENTHS